MTCMDFIVKHSISKNQKLAAQKKKKNQMYCLHTYACIYVYTYAFGDLPTGHQILHLKRKKSQCTKKVKLTRKHCWCFQPLREIFYFREMFKVVRSHSVLWSR